MPHVNPPSLEDAEEDSTTLVPSLTEGGESEDDHVGESIVEDVDRVGSELSEDELEAELERLRQDPEERLNDLLDNDEN